jgi:hypothetical protein
MEKRLLGEDALRKMIHATQATLELPYLDALNCVCHAAIEGEFKIPIRDPDSNLTLSATATEIAAMQQSLRGNA